MDSLPDSTAEYGSTRQRTLDYHEDIQQVDYPLIYRGNIATSEPLDSRRVLFNNLPITINPLQVTRTAAAFGQIISTSGVILEPQSGATLVLVDFADAIAATWCVTAVNSTNGLFVSEAGDCYTVGAWAIPTPSFPIPPDLVASLGDGKARTILVSPIDEECVWFLTKAIAPPGLILDVEYYAEKQCVVFEFSSVRMALAASAEIYSGLLDFLVEDKNVDIEIKSVPDKYMSGDASIWFPVDHLEQRFNRPPYNVYWPDTYYYVLTKRNLSLREKRRIRSDSSFETLADRESTDEFWTDESTVDGEDGVRGRQRPAKKLRYVWHIFRPTYSDKWNYSYPNTATRPDERLMDSEPEVDAELTRKWQSLFHNRETVGFHGWARYGKLARHRRQLAAEQGIAAGSGVIPQCDGTCEFGCRDISATPRSDQIDKFLVAALEDLLIDL